ncbi:MAG: S1/P1 nuclease [Patescibacteria group bacterium]|jgi:hypothetical protein|nr:S1/P1 nuclease [Patescibacteria group bacterium]
MYSGTTLTRMSGSVIGAHQKIDRIARKHLSVILPDIEFPTAKEIIKFEGDKGPDGIKRKSPANNEPWHFIDPNNPTNSPLIYDIELHYKNLVFALKQKDKIKMSFEAAWLAHAVVDGLTPAHHFPYDKELSKLRNGHSNEDRSTLKKKLVMPGIDSKEALKNNWKMWGPKGLFTTHASFEFGIATLIAPVRFNEFIPSKKDIDLVTDLDLNKWFLKNVRKVYRLDIYHEFMDSGWTLKMSQEIKNKLIPIIINSVTLIWYKAYQEVNQNK